MDFSATKDGLWASCPAQYRDRYVVPRAEQGKDMEVAPARDAGTVVHAAAQTVANQKIAEAPPTALRSAVTLEALTAAVEAQNVTDLETLDFSMKILKKCWRTFDFSHAIATEKQFRIPIGDLGDGESGALFGFIDRIDDMGGGWINIVDYKTGQDVLSRDEAMKSPQARYYLAVGRKMFPAAKRITFELHWLAQGKKTGPLETSKALDEITFMQARSVLRQIIAAKAAVAGAGPDAKDYDKIVAKAFPEKPGYPHCLSCARQSLCQTYKKWIRGTGEASSKDLPIVADTYREIRERKKLVESNEKQHSARLREEFRNKGDIGNEIYLPTGLKLVNKVISRGDLPGFMALKEIATKHGFPDEMLQSVSSVSKDALETWLDNYPDKTKAQAFWDEAQKILVYNTYSYVECEVVENKFSATAMAPKETA